MARPDDRPFSQAIAFRNQRRNVSFAWEHKQFPGNRIQIVVNSLVDSRQLLEKLKQFPGNCFWNERRNASIA